MLFAWIVFSLTNLFLTSHINFKLFCLCTAIRVPVVNQDLLFFSIHLEFLRSNTPSCGDSAGCVRSRMSVAALWTLSTIRVLNDLFEYVCCSIFWPSHLNCFPPCTKDHKEHKILMYLHVYGSDSCFHLFFPLSLSDVFYPFLVIYNSL